MLLQENGADNARTMIALVQIGLRIAGAIVCSNKAAKLNRSTTGWGWLGFIFPVISMIWIYCSKPYVIWEKNVRTNAN